MPFTPVVPVRPSPAGRASLALSLLALVIALSGTAYAAGLAKGSVGTPQLKNGAVTTPKLHANAVTGAKVRDGSLALRDLGGKVTDRVTTTSSPLTINANQCDPVFLALYNPAPAKILGSMVVGTITDAAGAAVVDNTGSILPTLLTETSQGGVIVSLEVCAGQSPQTVPAGSKVTWSLLRR
jgi:hypothetical protein